MTREENLHAGSVLWVIRYEPEPVYYFIDARNGFEPENIPLETDLFLRAVIYGADPEENTLSST